jgi:hypothetical protein
VLARLAFALLLLFVAGVILLACALYPDHVVGAMFFIAMLLSMALGARAGLQED